MNLPIDVVKLSPPRFRWQQVVHGQVIECEGMLPHGVEHAVVTLIDEHKRLVAEHMSLQGCVRMIVDRLGGTVEGRPTHEGNLLQRVDELILKEAAADGKPSQPTQQPTAPKKGK